MPKEAILPCSVVIGDTTRWSHSDGPWANTCCVIGAVQAYFELKILPRARCFRPQRPALPRWHWYRTTFSCTEFLRLFKMMWTAGGWLSSLWLLPGTVLGANLLVSHFSGGIYSLSLTISNGTGQLAVTSTLRAGGRTPSWLTLDSAAGNLYVTDEAQYGSPVLTSLKVNNDSSVQLVSTAPTSGGGVHSVLYGGNDGRGFFAVAE